MRTPKGEVMIATPAQNVKAVEVQIRVLDTHALVPSSKGTGCYHVDFECGISRHCSCPDHQRWGRVCKHMKAVDVVLAGRAEKVRGRDLYRADLVPQSRKAAPKGGALAKIAAEVERLEVEVQSAVTDPETREALEIERAREEWVEAQATESDWDSLYYW